MEMNETEHKQVRPREAFCSTSNASYRAMAMIFTGAFTLLGTSAQAQVPTGMFDVLLNEQGVDMASGQPVFSNEGLTIGSEGAPLMTFRSTRIPNGWTHNYNYKISGIIYNNADPLPDDDTNGLVVTTGGLSYRFEFDSSGGLFDRTGMGATLVKSGNDYILTDRGGDQFYFKSMTIPFDDYNVYGDDALYYATKITRADGEIIDIYYHEEVSGNGNPLRRRLQSVVSSRGYHLKLSYDANTRTSSNIYAWHRLAKAVLVNRSVEYCDPAALACTGLTLTWPSQLYSYSVVGNVETYTSFLTGGLVEQYIEDGNTFQRTLKRGTPAETMATFAMNFGSLPASVTDVSTMDGAWSYSGIYTDSAGLYTMFMPNGLTDQTFTLTVTDPDNRQRTSVSNVEASKLLEYTDELGRVTRFQYDAKKRLIYTLPPEATLSGSTPVAGYVRTFYDDRGNVIQTIAAPKQGSSLGNIVTTAGYPATCSNSKTCNKPVWTKDSRNSQSDYTYDPAHGGVISEMKPAPTPGGARPLRLTAYTQRYSWVKNAANVFVQLPDPVWLVSTVTECQTVPGSSTPACDAAAPQAVTSYEYGASGTRFSLVLKGLAVSSGGATLRTCFGYDNYNRRISETKPNAGLGVCP